MLSSKNGSRRTPNNKSWVFLLKSVDFLTSSIYTETINNLRRKGKSQMSIINTIKNFINRRKQEQQEWDDVDQMLNEALVDSYLEKM
nr:MAG TPA: hypothetical protein [Caudoviricetes sp.]